MGRPRRGSGFPGAPVRTALVVVVLGTGSLVLWTSDFGIRDVQPVITQGCPTVVAMTVS